MVPLFIYNNQDFRLQEIIAKLRNILHFAHTYLNALCETLNYVIFLWSNFQPAGLGGKPPPA